MRREEQLVDQIDLAEFLRTAGPEGFQHIGTNETFLSDLLPSIKNKERVQELYMEFCNDQMNACCCCLLCCLPTVFIACLWYDFASDRHHRKYFKAKWKDGKSLNAHIHFISPTEPMCTELKDRNARNTIRKQIESRQIGFE